MIWPKALRLMGIIHYDQFWRPFFLVGGLCIVVAGFALRFYQEEDKRSFLKNYLLKLAGAVVIVAVLMATGLIPSPDFL